MRLATSDQLHSLDKKTQISLHLGPDTLMEAAGTLAAQAIRVDFLPELKSQKKIIIVCGPGNNGADGLVVARHLHASGVRNLQVVVFDLKKGSPLFISQLSRVNNLRIPCEVVNSDGFHGAGLIIDAIFGIGLSKNISEPHASIIQAMNMCEAPKVSLDVPSGLDSDTGQIRGTSVKAHTTLTFGLSKPGFYTGEGPAFSGKIKIISIGHPRNLVRKMCDSYFLFTPRLARRFLPARSATAHKGSFGRLVVAAGSPGMWGALRLCVQAAYRMGAGYVTVAPAEHAEALKDWTQELGAEVLLTPLDISRLKPDAIVIGPGLGTGPASRALLDSVLKSDCEKVVLDADALTMLSQASVKLKRTFVMTPHAGELARLTGMSLEEIESNRFTAVKMASEKYGCTVLLKGFRTLVADTEGKVAIVHAGNQGLAKAGTGDVLSGFIGSLLAQGLENPWAALTGAFIHGTIADMWVQEGLESRTLMASDLAERVSSAIRSLTSY